jgi:hypothetical protein
MKHSLFITTCIFTGALGLASCGTNDGTNSQAQSAEATSTQSQYANPEPTAQEIAAVPHYSPPTGSDMPTRVYWGDTHLHTKLSQDAFTFGVTLGPDEAYKFAKGGAVKATHGEIAQLARPLDFLVVSDHAEGLGGMQALMNGNEMLLKSERLRGWKDGLEKSNTVSDRRIIAMDGVNNGWPPELDSSEIRKGSWAQIREAAERYNEPGKFTAFIGFEWTSWPGGSNLHRVVIFKDGAKKTGTVLPFSQNESDKPMDLWKYLENYESKTGGQVMSIPHNGNISNGLMFPILQENGEPLGEDYIKTRARWESIAEVTQIKGDGETHAYLSPNDEFADYDTWDFGNFAGVPKTKDMLEFEYARSALKNGLKLKTEYGTNPYKFGMIGATDSHTALATADENNFFGKHSAGMEPSATRWKDPVGKVDEQIVPGFLMAGAGYAGVWAKENTRESIWDAMKRKEVYGTTGPRMTLRFFGGADYQASDAHSSSFAKIGYAGGVPMGGDLTLKNGEAPHFLVAASKDPMSGNLDRVQIVKGWRSADGETHEKIYNVSWAGNRKIGADGKLPAIGSTVNVENASYTNSIGEAELSTLWIDPDFDAAQQAFYYVRVLEIPTPRWTAYDAKYYKSVMAPTVKMQHQERAYSSPIWYTPQ